MEKTTPFLSGVNSRIKNSEPLTDSEPDILSRLLLEDEDLCRMLSSYDQDNESDISERMKGAELFFIENEHLYEPTEGVTPAIHLWVLDRCAFFGANPALIQKLVRNKFGEEIPLERLDRFIRHSRTAIVRRRRMMLKDIEASALPISKLITERVNEMNTILRDITENREYRYYGQIASQWIKSLELLGKILGQFRDDSAVVNITQTNIQNNLVMASLSEDVATQLRAELPKEEAEKAIKIFKGTLGKTYDLSKAEDSSYAFQQIQ